MKQFTRQEILSRLRAKIDKGAPITMGGAGIGLVAKAADRAGIDILMAYNTGPFRMDGHPSFSGYLAYGDSNAMTLRLARQILPVVENTPVIGGIGAGDPYRDLKQLIDEMMAAGFSGITNVPTAGVYDGDMRRHIDEMGIGYPEEVKLIKMCRSRDIFTVAYAFTEEECAKMAEAGADIIGTHVGVTSGGMIGGKGVPTIDLACEKTEKMCQAALKVKPDVILVSHGGPFEDPVSVQAAYDRTSVHGYLGASSVERIPVEKAILEVVKEFQSLTIRKRSK
jgi:predicted TIM-barrel enzyme